MAEERNAEVFGCSSSRRLARVATLRRRRRRRRATTSSRLLHPSVDPESPNTSRYHYQQSSTLQGDMIFMLFVNIKTYLDSNIIFIYFDENLGMMTDPGQSM